MIILAVIKDEDREAKRGREIGNAVRYRVGIGFDNYNVLIADTTSDTWVGRKFHPNFSQLLKNLDEFDVDVEKTRQTVRDALSYAFDKKLPEEITIEEMDKEFAISERRSDSSGVLKISDVLKSKFGNIAVVCE